jgi:hypothetical protein
MSEYLWTYSGGRHDESYGPFDSLEDALEDVRDAMRDNGQVLCPEDITIYRVEEAYKLPEALPSGGDQ